MLKLQYSNVHYFIKALSGKYAKEYVQNKADQSKTGKIITIA